MPSRSSRAPRSLGQLSRLLPTAPGLTGSKVAILVTAHNNAVEAQQASEQEAAQLEGEGDADQSQQAQASVPEPDTKE